MPAVVEILFGAGITAATAMALGLLLFRRISAPISRLEHYLFSYVTGSALLSLLVFFACAAHLARTGVFVIIAAVAIVACIVVRAYRRECVTFPASPVLERLLLLLIMVGFGYVSFVHALAPEWSPDGSTYHLGLVGRYWRESGFVPVATNMYAQLTQGFELLFVFAYAFGRHSAAALVHWTFLITLPLTIIAYARRFRLGTAGVLAAVLVFASPVVLVDGASAYNDVALACVLFVMFYLLRLELWAPAGLLAGFAIAIKYTGFLAAPYALAVARRIRPMAVITACAALMTVPWFVKNHAYVGNPVAPFFNSVFPNPYFYPDFERNFAERMRHYGDVTWREVPVEATVRGVRLAGFLGPVFLLVPLAFIALANREGRRVLIAAALFTATYPLNIGTRFLVPALPFWSLAFGIAAANVRAVALLLALAHAVSSWPPYARRYSDRGAWALDRRPPIKAALRLIPEDKYLSDRTRGYDMARMAEEYVPADKRIFTIGAMVADAYTGRKLVVGFQSSFGKRAIDLLWTPLTDDYDVLQQQEFRWPARPVRRVRIVQTAAHDADMWSISELNLVSSGTELRMRPAWHLTARPNPWEQWRALDGSEATRWTTHVSLRPGQFFELDLGRVETLDGLRMKTTRDQYQVRLAFELDGKPVATTMTQLGPAAPISRRAISAELKRDGIDYLMLDNADYGAADVHDRSGDWGLRLVAERAGARLYRIE